MIWVIICAISSLTDSIKLVIIEFIYYSGVTYEFHNFNVK